jgi:hypothetical protein
MEHFAAVSKLVQGEGFLNAVQRFFQMASGPEVIPSAPLLLREALALL